MNGIPQILVNYKREGIAKYGLKIKTSGERNVKKHRPFPEHLNFL